MIKDDLLFVKREIEIMKLKIILIDIRGYYFVSLFLYNALNDVFDLVYRALILPLLLFLRDIEYEAQ